MSSITLPTPYPKQQELLRSAKRNNLWVLSRRFGKTTLVSRIAHHRGLTQEKCRIAYSAPTWKLMIETFEAYIKVLEPAISRLSRAEHRIELVNGSVIELWSSSDISAGRGRRYHLWVSDESQRQKNLAKFIRGSVRPTLADFRGELYVLGTADGEGSEFHNFYQDCVADNAWFVAEGRLEDNPYIHPDEILQMRQDLGPELAAQELDSQWIRISGRTPLIRELLWNELVEEWDSTRYMPSRTLAVDASISGDKTAVIGVFENQELYYVPAGDIQLFDPTLDGEIDFASVERYLLERWRTGQYTRIAYDPYQFVAVAQSLRAKGVRMFELTQNAERIKSDTFLKQILTEKRLRHPDNVDLTEHILNAVLRFAGGQTNNFRITKPHREKKIDLTIALSMALWTHKNFGGSTQPYSPVTAVQSSQSPLQIILPASPFITDIYSPWK